MTPTAEHLLRYRPLRDGGHSLCFPCDPQGHIDLNALTERARIDYLFARAVVGRQFAPPVLECVH